jgi:hypothetical protein
MIGLSLRNVWSVEIECLEMVGHESRRHAHVADRRAQEAVNDLKGEADLNERVAGQRLLAGDAARALAFSQTG